MRKYIIYFLTVGLSLLSADVNEDLLNGAAEGNFALVKYAIEHRADLETRNEEGETALILSAWYGAADIVRFLIENGANVNAQDKEGYTALAKTSSLGIGRHYEIVEVLVHASANVNIKTKAGHSPFLLAVMNGHPELSELLKKAGAEEDKYFSGEEADKELLDASNLGDAKRVKYVILFNPNLNTMSKDGITPLMNSARNGNKEILNLLLKAGAKVGQQDKTGKTALMYAARRGHKEVINLLLDFDADVDLEDNEKFTAIIWAERFGQIEIADYLKRLSEK